MDSISTERFKYKLEKHNSTTKLCHSFKDYRYRCKMKLELIVNMNLVIFWSIKMIWCSTLDIRFTKIKLLGAPVGSLLGAVLGADVGSLLGAVLGADVGSLLGAWLGSEVIGASVGALVGALVGTEVAQSKY